MLKMDFLPNALRYKRCLQTVASLGLDAMVPTGLGLHGPFNVSEVRTGRPFVESSGMRDLSKAQANGLETWPL